MSISMSPADKSNCLSWSGTNGQIERTVVNGSDSDSDSDSEEGEGIKSSIHQPMGLSVSVSIGASQTADELHRWMTQQTEWTTST